MAEGFAKAYGRGVLEALSAGVAPYSHVPEPTRRSMQEKGIDLSLHFPKHISEMAGENLHLVINMSGAPLPPLPFPIRDWIIRDPFGSGPATYRSVRDEIEGRVMELVLELRSTPPPTA